MRAQTSRTRRNGPRGPRQDHVLRAPAAGEWESERDARFASFLARRLAEVEETGCLPERKLAAGILDLLTAWNQQRAQARAAHPDAGPAVADGMGWALRCLAHSAWRNTPGWEGAFHPEATAPVPPLAGRGGYVPGRRQP
ncbi:hypothetical protein ACIQVK_38430 [Streptomyces sp. NPDC090493]|uniref:hypothetical protein n=1 Tax=Streptomyces sp. NPDC090493 TaxID=3365964 RepID=UPI003828CF39